MKNKKYHESVLTHEVIEAFAHLKNQAQKKIIDATLGTGGHTEALLKEGFNVLGIDADKNMIEIAGERLNTVLYKPEYFGKYKLIHGNFKDIGDIAEKEGYIGIQGILMDLGVSNIQLMGKGRGFSFGSPDAVLDMRIDPSIQGLQAKDLINVLREDQLKFLFARIVHPSDAGKIASEIIKVRSEKKFETMNDFLPICEVIKGKKGLNKATLPLLALRIAVNSELENIKEALPKAFSLLYPGGKLVVITFHSKEEEIVLSYMEKMEGLKLARLEKKGVIAKESELDENLKARSAKMFVLTKK